MEKGVSSVITRSEMKLQCKWQSRICTGNADKRGRHFEQRWRNGSRFPVMKTNITLVFIQYGIFLAQPNAP